MTDINSVYGSADYLKASDLQGKNMTLTMESIEVKVMDRNQKKLVISFEGARKRLVCNKTNAKSIAKLYGTDTDEWPGQQITLFPTTVEFQGDMTDAIRIKAPQRAPKPAAGRRVVAQHDELNPPDPLDDEIPF